jgi:hypothetical protein
LSAVRSDEELLRDFSIALTGRIRLGDLVLQGAQMLMLLILCRQHEPPRRILATIV